MKKMIVAALIMFTFASVSFAQTAQPKKATDTKPAAPKAATTSATHTKKDGTADMRYKENKTPTTPPATTHTKKDGTPDKRYKENKPKTN